MFVVAFSKRSQVAVVMLASCILCWAGCRDATKLKSGPEVASKNSARPAIVVTDALQRKVTLARPPQRIVALSPSICEILFAMGCGDRVVLRDKASNFPVQVRRLPATNAFQLSPEHIAGFTPDLVLVHHLDAQRIAGLTALGIPVAVFDPRSVKEVLYDITRIGQLCGELKRAQTLVRELYHRLDRLKHRFHTRRRPSVYVELDGADPLKPWTAGARSLVNDVVRLAGGTNVFTDLNKAAAQVNAEAVIGRMPEFIVLTMPMQGRTAMVNSVATRAGWQTIPAVQDDHIVSSIDSDLLTRPSYRLVDGIEALSDVLHGTRGAIDRLSSKHGAQRRP